MKREVSEEHNVRRNFPSFSRTVVLPPPAGLSHILMGDIFYSLQLGKLSNVSLLLRLCGGWFIDVIILSTWAAIDPLTIHLQMIDEEVNKHDNLLA